METGPNGFGEFADGLMPLLLEHGLSLIGAILILVVGWMFANWAAVKVRKRAAAAERFDDTLVPIFGQTVRVLILVVTVLAVLGQFGVQTASLVAILGAAGLAVGLALQGTLGNIAAGIMLLILRPFRVGDVVDVGGTMGVVDEIGLFTTEMHTFDNIGIVMPNSRVWGTQIMNYSRYDTRRVDMEFGIGYGDDMEKAMRLISEALEEDDRVLDDPAPLIAVSNLGESSVDIRVRPWTRTSDVWPLRYHLTKRIKEKFDANGITIPFPQRDVHLFNQK